jgi:methionyl aminopeptidase
MLAAMLNRIKDHTISGKIAKTVFEAMWAGIEVVRPGATLGDIGHAIQQHAEANHFSVVREYCGHGIGKVFHEEPQVLHYGNAGTGIILEPGMTFSDEPGIYIRDEFGVRLEDDMVITAGGAELMTPQSTSLEDPFADVP